MIPQNESEVVNYVENENELNIDAITGDGKSTIVPYKYLAEMCLFIKDTFEDMTEQSGIFKLDIKTVEDAELFRSIYEYCKYHYNNKAKKLEKPLKDGNLKPYVSEWDYDFITKFGNFNRLGKLATATNYLNCQDLLHLTCAKMASFIPGKTIEELRELFGVENDFTPEEEEKIRKENAWIDN